MIEAKGLTKRYGDKLAVDDLSFTMRPGVVTEFIAPNGWGKAESWILTLLLAVH
jgi:ABC-2 type transport system ATP-binding protein